MAGRCGVKRIPKLELRETPRKLVEKFEEKVELIIKMNQIKLKEAIVVIILTHLP
jgi:hypothetical protein